MRHKIKGRKLNRTSSHRKSLLINLATALFRHESINTTLPKAKELRPFAEKIMTLAKSDNLSSKRKVYSVIKEKALVDKLFSDIAERIKDRNGGYTRIMHNGFRSGDKAPMAIIQLVDFVVEDDSGSDAKSDDKLKGSKIKKDSKGDVQEDGLVKKQQSK